MSRKGRYRLAAFGFFKYIPALDGSKLKRLTVGAVLI
jgi:hypothetical protein